MTGQEIKEFRRKTGLSQTEFGKRLGFKSPQIYISRIERGRLAVGLRLESQILMWIENERSKR